ncbi:hypothetical protein RvY_15840 [Ramazzottius varieornatus]|uniref:Spaetzle domain-containing protein n=1 Tax=Ramazzottius varieornatus TaxID=947166 RepID=A0A1D1VWC1_RAMVA|nr:hypothetical protein RvY_15840 [Ramazzottius varieornatus]
MVSELAYVLRVWLVTVVEIGLLSSGPARAQSIATSCGQQFCERSSAYPVVPEIQKVLESDRSFAPLKQALTSLTPNKTSKMADDDPVLPRGDPHYQICPSDLELIFPQEAMNTRGQRKFIINFGPFAQSVAMERCRPEMYSLPCNYVGVPPEYSSTCVQKEMEHRLTTIDSDPNVGSVETSVDVFRFPSYCACQLVKGGQRYAAPLCASPGPAVVPVPPPNEVGYFARSPFSADDTNVSVVRKAKTPQDNLGLESKARTEKKAPRQSRMQSGGLGSRTLDLFAQ